MTRQDLLDRMAQVSRGLSIIVTEARTRQDDDIPPDALREIGQVLHDLGEDLLTHANNLDHEEAPC